MGTNEFGDKIKSSGEDGFIMINFSNLRDGWSNVGDAVHKPVDENGFSNGVSGNAGKTWADRVRGLPKGDAPIDSPASPGASPHGGVINRDAPLTGEALKIERMVQDTILHMDVVDLAKQRRSERDKPEFEEPEVMDAEDLLAEEDNPTLYKVDQLWPSGGNVLFAAAAKFGKSTTIMNLIRALLDGTAFLGHFEVAQIPDDEAILFVDLEMSKDRVRREFREQEIGPFRGRLIVTCIRGAARDFDLSDPEARDYWVALCQERNVKTLILDPLAPLLGQAGVDENDNTTVNQFLQKLDEFKLDAGIRDMLVAHHCGHSADMRPRGASRFNDWPDALWLAKIDGAVDDPNSPRKFFVRGRDVGEGFQSSAVIHQELDNKKRLVIDMASAAVSVSDNDFIQGVLAALAQHPNGLQCSSTSAARETVMTELHQQHLDGALAQDPQKPRIERLLAKMAQDGILCTHPGTGAGRTPPTLYRVRCSACGG